MALNRLPTPGLDLQAELAIAQFVIPAGAGATYAQANSIATVTFNAAHGLTMAPAAGVPPNYFIGFGGSTSAPTGTGVLVGNIFRILTIPSTTAITIWAPGLTALTVTSLTGIPIFFPPFTASVGSVWAGGPTQTISAVVTPEPPANLEGASILCSLGANCAVRYNPAQDAIIIDQFSSPLSIPAAAPTWRDAIAASGKGFCNLSPPWGAIWANGTTATSNISVFN